MLKKHSLYLVIGMLVFSAVFAGCGGNKPAAAPQTNRVNQAQNTQNIKKQEESKWQEESKRREEAKRQEEAKKKEEAEKAKLRFHDVNAMQLPISGGYIRFWCVVENVSNESIHLSSLHQFHLRKEGVNTFQADSAGAYASGFTKVKDTKLDLNKRDLGMLKGNVDTSVELWPGDTALAVITFKTGMSLDEMSGAKLYRKDSVKDTLQLVYTIE